MTWRKQYGRITVERMVMKLTSIEEKRDRLQRNLALIRTCAGWNAATLGEMLGVSRQMVSNLETNQSKMTIMQYRAIRQAFSEEIENSPDDTQMLSDLLKALVDEPEKFTSEQLNQILSDANLLAPSIVTKKTTRKKASSTWGVALAGVVVAAVLVGVKAVVSDRD